MAAHLRDLFGMEIDLAVLGARIVDVEDPLEMAQAAGAGGAANSSGMEGMAFEERAAQQRIEGRKRSDELTARAEACFLGFRAINKQLSVECQDIFIGKWFI